jgi:hypothetical protein
MAFTETSKEKEKREAYYKANKERGIRAEKQKEYEMFGTTEQNIPKVDTMGNVTGMKKGGKVMKKMKKYNGEEGSEVEFETKTGKNKMIDDDTRIKAADYASLDVDAEPRITKDAPKAKSPSPKGAKAFTRAETGGGAALMTRKDRSGMPKTKAKSSSYTPDHTMGMAMKKGGSVKSASARADGCAIRGKTRA